MEKQELKKLVLDLHGHQIVMRKDETSHSVSRIGGDPWVPEDFVWPERNGKKMELFFQLDFEELAAYDTDYVFPEKGVVSVFYDIHEMPWGYEKEDADGIKAFYFPDKSKLRETSSGRVLPEADELFGFGSCQLLIPDFRLSFGNKESRLSTEDFGYYFEDMQIPMEELTNAYNELGLPAEAEYEERDDDDVDEILALGLSNAVQNGMLIEIKNRLEAGVVDHPVDRRDSKSVFEDWVLLINIPCNSETDIYFSIAEPGYFSVYIRKSDLKERNFDRLLYSVDIY